MTRKAEARQRKEERRNVRAERKVVLNNEVSGSSIDQAVEQGRDGEFNHGRWQNDHDSEFGKFRSIQSSSELPRKRNRKEENWYNDRHVLTQSSIQPVVKKIKSEYHDPQQSDRGKDTKRTDNSILHHDHSDSDWDINQPIKSEENYPIEVKQEENYPIEVKQELEFDGLPHSVDTSFQFREPDLQFSVCLKLPKDGTQLYVCGNVPEMGGSIDPFRIKNRGIKLEESGSYNHYETSHFITIKSRASNEELQYIYYMYHPLNGVTDVETIRNPRRILIPEPQPPYDDDEIRFCISDYRYNDLTKPPDIRLAKSIYGSSKEIEI